MKMSDLRADYVLRSTPYRTDGGQQLYYTCIAGDWRIVWQEGREGNVVGSVYWEQADLLADLPRYAKEAGFPGVAGREVIAGYVVAMPLHRGAWAGQAPLLLDGGGEGEQPMILDTIDTARHRLDEIRGDGYRDYGIYALREVTP